MNIFRFYKTSDSSKKLGDDKKKRRMEIGRKTLVIATSLLFFVLIAGILFFGSRPAYTRLHLGKVSQTDIFAPISFQYPDTAQMEIERARTIHSAPPVYGIDKNITATVMKNVSGYTSYLQKLSAPSAELDTKSVLEKISKNFNVKLTAKELQQIINGLAPKTFEIFTGNITKALAKGVLSAHDASRAQTTSDGTILLAPIANGQKELNIKKFKIIESLDRAKLFSGAPAAPSGSLGAQAQILLLESVRPMLRTNLIMNEELTQALKDQSLAELPYLYKYVQKGQILVRRGDSIAQAHLDKIEAMNEALETRTSMREKWQAFAGIMLMLLIVCAIFTIYALRYLKAELAATNRIILVLLTVSATIIISYLVHTSFAASDFYWIGYMPLVPAAAIVLAVLCDHRIASLITIALSLAVATLCGADFGIGLTNTISSLVAICSLKGIRKRAMLVKVGLLTGLAGAGTEVALSLLQNNDLRTMLIQSSGNFFGGVACAAGVMLLLPLLENTFRFTTDFTLMELSDLNHPLLKELMLNASGTYHHCLMVASLAESAAELVDANPLLCRVGGYFHDIGKIEKPDYFSENEPAPGKSIHDELAPSMSSLIIISHVKNGIEKARTHKIPKPVSDIIAQHHGTGLVFFFYKKAQAALEADETKQIKEEQFMYPGPKPQTKEAGILMLADIAEAASRSLDNPTPGRIEGLVKDLVNNKFIDAQLDECPLTLKDLHLITERFTRMLTAVFHTRTRYPEKDKNNKKNGTAK